MANGLKQHQQNVFNGLGTSTYTVPSSYTGLYTIEVRANKQDNSALSLVINLNGSPIATAPAPRPFQRELDLRIQVNCVPGDVITVVASSSAAIDQQPLSIKGTIIVRQGL